MRMKRLQRVEGSNQQAGTAQTGDSAPVQDSALSVPTSAAGLNVDPSTSSPQKKVVRNEHSTSPNPPAQASVSVTPKKADPQAAEALRLHRDAVALNLSLEHALQLTLRSDAAVDSIRYIGHEHNNGTLLSTTNISELICNFLAEENVNAVQYLTGCYKRIAVKESAVTPGVATELAR
jgi:hypothetical protein